MNLLYLIIALQLGDLLTTAIMLKRKGAYEGNRFMAALFAKIGVLPGLILVKSAVIVLLMWLAPVADTWALWVIAGISGAVLVNNLIVMRKVARWH